MVAVHATPQQVGWQCLAKGPSWTPGPEPPWPAQGSVSHGGCIAGLAAAAQDALRALLARSATPTHAAGLPAGWAPRLTDVLLALGATTA